MTSPICTISINKNTPSIYDDNISGTRINNDGVIYDITKNVPFKNGFPITCSYDLSELKPEQVYKLYHRIFYDNLDRDFMPRPNKPGIKEKNNKLKKIEGYDYDNVKKNFIQEAINNNNFICIKTEDSKNFLNNDVYDDNGDSSINMCEDYKKIFPNKFQDILTNTCFNTNQSSNMEEALKPRCTGWNNKTQKFLTPNGFKTCKQLYDDAVKGKGINNYNNNCSSKLQTLCKQFNIPNDALTNADSSTTPSQSTDSSISPLLRVCGCNLDKMKITPEMSKKIKDTENWYKLYLKTIYGVDTSLLCDNDDCKLIDEGGNPVKLTPTGSQTIEQLISQVTFADKCGQRDFYKPCQLCENYGYTQVGNGGYASPCEPPTINTCINSFKVSNKGGKIGGDIIVSQSNDCKQFFCKINKQGNCDGGSSGDSSGGESSGGESSGGESSGGGKNKLSITTIIIIVIISIIIIILTVLLIYFRKNILRLF